jgi:hypothetical protein
MSRHVKRDELPAGRTVILFDFHGPPPRWLWMTLEPADVSVCLRDPGLPVDLVVSGAVSDMFQVYMGRTTLAEALDADRVRLAGVGSAVRGFHRWMRWSAFAEAAATGAARRPLPAGPAGP